MKRNTWILVVLAIVLTNCNIGNTNKIAIEEEVKEMEEVMTKDVPYIEARNYFVLNTIENAKVESLRITSQDHFESYFGTATTMGEQGSPTPIDFKKSFVLALVGQRTERDTSFEINRLIEKGDRLELSYTIKQSGENRSFTIHPCLILVVDKTNEKDVRFIAE